MTYLPKIESQNCIIVDNLNNGYIRVYDRTPSSNSTIGYIDYFIDKDYITRTGTQSFSNYNYNLNCQSHSDFTTEFYYRIDFDKIMVIFVLLAIFVVYIPLKCVFRLFRRMR